MGLIGSSYRDMEMIREYLSDNFNGESAQLVVSIQKNDLWQAEKAAKMIAEKYAAMERETKSLKEENSRLKKENSALIEEVNRLKEENNLLLAGNSRVKRRKDYDVERIEQLYLETHSLRKVAEATNVSAKTVKSLLIEEGYFGAQGGGD